MSSLAYGFKILPIAGAVVSISLAASPAHAIQSVSFTTTTPGAENVSSRVFQSNPGGVAFTVTNPNTTFDSVGGVNTNSAGLCAWAQIGTSGGRCGFNSGAGFSGQVLNELAGTFNKPVTLTSFRIGGVSAGNNGTILAFQSGSFFQQFSITGAGNYTFASPFEVAAGKNLALISSGNNTTGTNGGFFRVSSLDVIDVPGPLPLLGGAAAFGWSRKLRNKIKLAG